MKIILIKTYCNGGSVQGVFPIVYKYLSAAEKQAEVLNSKRDKHTCNEGRWFPMLLHEYNEADW